MLDIYKYTEFHKFLTDAWREKRSRNPSFSMTAWAQQLGLENSSPLSLAFKGKRALPKKYLPQIIRTLDLDAEQSHYLEALLDLSRAKTAEQKLLYLERLKTLAPGSDINGEIVEEYKYMSEPIHGAIIEMTDLRSFNRDPAWIQQRLSFNVSISEINEAIDRLLQLNLLKETENHRLQKLHRHFTTPPDVADLGTKHYHKTVSEMAAEAVFAQDITRREFNSYSFNLKKDKIAHAKKKMRKFINDFLNEFEAPVGEGDETYQLNLQLFQITK
jgi:uncharacterized protein (TIGR02147 family)